MNVQSLSPEQQKFAEENHGLLLSFMSRFRLSPDFYDVLALRYVTTVRRYCSEPKLQTYAFSTILWRHLRSELSHEIKRLSRMPSEVAIDDLYRPPPSEDSYIDRNLWEQIEENLTKKQCEVVFLRNQGYTNREISALCGVSVKAVEKRFKRIRTILNNWRM